MEDITWENTTLKSFLYELGYIPKGWEDFFEINRKIIYDISDKLKKETRQIYPPIHLVFKAFKYFNPKKTKVLILGQDPYHNGSAVGLCFSIKPGNSINPSLLNIYKELKDEGYTPKEDGKLIYWAKQGVMLLNTALTVTRGNAGSHLLLWDNFTSKVISYITEKSNCVCLLLGDKSIMYSKYISKICPIVRASHPSPFSANKYSKLSGRAFMKSGVFEEVNSKLKEEIEW